MRTKAGQRYFLLGFFSMRQTGIGIGIFVSLGVAERRDEAVINLISVRCTYSALVMGGCR